MVFCCALIPVSSAPDGQAIPTPFPAPGEGWGGVWDNATVTPGVRAPLR
jgi:hypothetical protein